MFELRFVNWVINEHDDDDDDIMTKLTGRTKALRCAVWFIWLIAPIHQLRQNLRVNKQWTRASKHRVYFIAASANHSMVLLHAPSSQHLHVLFSVGIPATFIYRLIQSRTARMNNYARPAVTEELPEISSPDKRLTKRNVCKLVSEKERRFIRYSFIIPRLISTRVCMWRYFFTTI